MIVPRLDFACISLLPLWDSQLDSRDELGNLIISTEIERQIEEIIKLARERRAKIAPKKGDKVRGRKRNLKIPDVRELRIEFCRDGVTITSLAKRYGCSRAWISKKLREKEQGGIDEERENKN